MDANLDNIDIHLDRITDNLASLADIVEKLNDFETPLTTEERIRLQFRLKMINENTESARAYVKAEMDEKTKPFWQNLLRK